MCSFSLLAYSSCSPKTPSGVLLAFSACSVTIHTCPASVMLCAAASRKIVCASSVLRESARESFTEGIVNDGFYAISDTAYKLRNMLGPVIIDV